MGRRRSEITTNPAAFAEWSSEELDFIVSILDSSKTLESLANHGDGMPTLLETV